MIRNLFKKVWQAALLLYLAFWLTACGYSSSVPASEAVRPFTFAVFGDIRTEGRYPPPIFNKFVEQARLAQPDAVLLVGDIINAAESRSEVSLQWGALQQSLAPLSFTRFVPTIGNHETNEQHWAAPFYREAFPALPANGPPALLGYVYSLNQGPVHFVSLASEFPGRENSLGADQLDWLERDLAGNKQPYTIILTHDPAYPVGPHIGESLDVTPADRDRLWQLLKKYKVTAFIAGHEHLYNRSVHDGIPQLIIGTSGSPIYAGYGGDFYHYALFTVTKDGLQGRIYDENGKERDNFLIR